VTLDELAASPPQPSRNQPNLKAPQTSTSVSDQFYTRIMGAFRDSPDRRPGYNVNRLSLR